MKRRRALTTIASCLLWPAIAPAQPSKRVPVVGMLITHAPVNDPVVEAVRSREILPEHADPADRFLVATALIYDLTLVTADQALIKSKPCPILAAS